MWVAPQWWAAHSVRSAQTESWQVNFLWIPFLNLKACHQFLWALTHLEKNGGVPGTSPPPCLTGRTKKQQHGMGHNNYQVPASGDGVSDLMTTIPNIPLWIIKITKTLQYLHPGRITWNLQITQLKRKMIFQTIIFRFHLNLPGCTCWGWVV